jgi:sentrin-specific protease 7
MNNSRMRAINDQRPRSSMKIGQSAQTDRSDTSRDERSNKRIKKSGPEPSCASRYFSSSRLAPLEAIENDSEPSAKAPWHHNLTREDSYAETLGGSSVISSSNLTTAAGSCVAEYRSVQRRSTVKRSRRRPRGPRRNNPSPSESDDDTVAVAHRNLPPQQSPTLTSPDCLSMNIHNNSDGPSSANISPDLPLQSKRSATDYAQSTPKRYRLYNDSEDELAKPGTSAVTETPTRPTSVTKLVSRSPYSRTQRGEIKPTNFGSAMERRNSTRSGPKVDGVLLVAAACGRSTWSAGKTDEPITLHLDSGLAHPSHQGRQTFSWLELSKKSIHGVKHSNSQSPIISIHRSNTGTTVGGKLVLKFSDIANASIFIAWLHGVERLNEVSPVELENTFSKAMGEAKSFASKSKNSPVPISPVPFTASTPRPPQSSHRNPFQGEPISPRRPKLKDRMQGGLPILQEEAKEEVKMKTEDVEDPFLESSRKRKPETRQTRKSSPEPLPLSWTAQNPGWDKDWHRSLVYPPTGKNRATVDKEDIIRLDEGEFLNDNLISFYLRYLQVQLEKERPEILEKVYIFNTFFFEKLRSNRAKINYEGVKAWTARVDLLSYDYIVVPVNENAHWYLAIIYNAPRLLPKEVKAEMKAEASKKDESSSLQDAIIVEDNDPAVEVAENVSVKKASPVVSLDHEAPRSTRSQAATGDGVVLLDNETVKNSEAPNKTNKRKSTGGNQKYSTDEPRIITLDSLGAAHAATCKCLRDYLVEEAKDKKGIDIMDRPGGMTARGIPEQDNYCDCGVYVLGYMENFLRDPDEAVRRLLQKEASQWVIKPQQIRAKVRDLLFDFQQEQHLRLEREKELKRKRRATKGPVSSPQVAPSSPQVPQRAPETPQANHGPKSTLVNDTIPAESEEPPQAGTTSAYFTVASPEEPLRPQTPTRNEEPSFVQPLREGSSNDSKISSSGDVFHSARSSPVDTSQQMLPDLTTESHSPRIERSRPKPPSTPNFVQKLSESPEEAGPTSISSTVKIHSSPSVALATKQRASASPAEGSPSVFGGKRIVMKSIEDTSHREAQYNGVERTIDLTG